MSVDEERIVSHRVETDIPALFRLQNEDESWMNTRDAL